ncbi:MAG: long-chain fatty acid--CoA ligase [Chloroflexi bacterium]|nr:MAG: long-chain fatty acid--CoA ligase [Chloroflexota bacterium]
MSQNLAQLAEDAFARLGDHEALVFEGRTWRSAELRDRAGRTAAGFAALGVLPGDRVVVLMANCPEVLIAYGALWRAGAVITPVVFLVSGDELAHILSDSGATTVVTTAELLGTVMRVTDRAPDLRHILVAGGDGDAGLGITAAGAGVTVTSFSDLDAGAASGIVPRSDDDLAALLYTGGTTGRAKGVALTHHQLAGAGRGLWEAAHVPGVTRTLTPLPLSHAYGLIVSIAGLYADEPGLAIVQRWFNPSDWIGLCEEHRVQRSALVPAMIQMLLAERLEDADLSSLRLLGSGAAPLPLDVLQEFERRVPGCEIHEGYGCTESSAVVTASRPGRRRLGSVGTPVSGYTVHILDDEHRPLAAGEDGEICVRGLGVMSGYWHDPEASAAALRDGWLHTGDIGHLDADGYLYVVDRKKDLILRGGFNVFPRDVEDVLLTHPDVTGAGVVGRPDPRLGEEVVAFVTLRPGAAAVSADLVTYAREHLAANKYPREIRIVDGLPLTSVGKLDRKRLRTLVQ